MKNFRRKALPALTMLVIAILCLTGVTYAWFTTGKNVEVSNVYVNVTGTTGGILVSSTQNGTYSNSFSWNNSTQKIEPVSTAGHRVHGKNGADEVKGSDTINFFKGEIDSAAGNALLSSTADSSNYVKFDIWFESLDKGSKNVYFNYTNEYELFGKTSANDVDLSAQSIRIAFVYQGTRKTRLSTSPWVDCEVTLKAFDAVTITEFDSKVTYYEAAKTTDSTVVGSSKDYYTLADGVYTKVEKPVNDDKENYYEINAVGTAEFEETKTYCTSKPDIELVDRPLTSSIMIIEPWDTVHTASGLASVSDQQSYYGLKAEFHVDADEEDDSSDESDWDFIRQSSLPILPSAALSNEDAEIYEVVTTHKVMNCLSGGTPLFKLYQGYTHVTVYIWIEGQDIDCTNTIANLASTLNLKFAVE